MPRLPPCVSDPGRLVRQVNESCRTPRQGADHDTDCVYARVHDCARNGVKVPAPLAFVDSLRPGRRCCGCRTDRGIVDRSRTSFAASGGKLHEKPALIGMLRTGTRSVSPDDSPCATTVSAVLKLGTLGNLGTADTAVAQVDCGLVNNRG